VNQKSSDAIEKIKDRSQEAAERIKKVTNGVTDRLFFSPKI
jgi:hypothetical protein